MEFVKSEIKNIIIFVAVLGGLYFVYTYFFAAETSSDPTVVLSATAGGSVGGEVLPLLLELREIKLKTEIFNDPIFRELKNFSTDLVLTDDQKGRENPFAPFEGGVAPSSPQINIGVGTLTN